MTIEYQTNVGLGWHAALTKNIQFAYDLTIRVR